MSGGRGAGTMHHSSRVSALDGVPCVILTGVDKNIDKWLQVANYGERVRGTCIIPTKTFSRNPAHSHTVPSFLTENPTVTAVIDLSSEADNYSISGPFSHVQHIKLSFESKVIPSVQHVNDFIDIVRSNSHPDDPDALIAVHCHYGYNRTGFLICSYLCEVNGLSPSDAIEEFKLARPPGIRHEHFINELHDRYKCNNTPKLSQNSSVQSFTRNI